jgi:hypothetical protein
MTPQWKNLQLRNHGEGQHPHRVVAAVKKGKKWNFVYKMWNVMYCYVVLCIHVHVKIKARVVKRKPTLTKFDIVA